MLSFALGCGASSTPHGSSAGSKGSAPNGGSQDPGSGSSGGAQGDGSGSSGGSQGNGSGDGVSEDVYRIRRERMVATQIRARGITDPRVLAAMSKVPRHLFIPAEARAYAYDDGPVPIGEDQTISQPYIVALMTELARPQPSHRVLEVGTGSGYQAAVLAELVSEVDTIEILEPLGRAAASLLHDLGYTNVHPRIGDGYRGWPEKAPFDAILVTAAAGKIPEPLKQQLAVGGRLVIPVGTTSQDLILLTRTQDGFHEETITPVRFVPMTGQAEKDR